MSACRWCGAEIEPLHGLWCPGPPAEYYASEEFAKESAESMRRSIRDAVEKLERDGIDAESHRHALVRRNLSGLADVLRRAFPGAFSP